MIRIFLISMLCSILYVPVVAFGASQDDVSTPVQVVAALQKIPHYEIFCEDETWGSTEPIKVGAKFAPYLSKNFYKLFMWSQCVEPEMPPFYVDLSNKFLWDIRFGFENGGREDMEDNVRVRPAKTKGSDKAIVKVLYDFGTLKNLVTTYTLIREDGHWKIDDIAPKGDYVEEGEQEPHLEHSDSIKTDMQNNYDAAERRYQQEKAKKSAK
jgi:hypothetical protein